MLAQNEGYVCVKPAKNLVCSICHGDFKHYLDVVLLQFKDIYISSIFPVWSEPISSVKDLKHILVNSRIIMKYSGIYTMRHTWCINIVSVVYTDVFLWRPTIYSFP